MTEQTTAKVREVTPRAYFLAETGVDLESMRFALKDLGAEDWHTDASEDASLLSEFAGKSCYMSFDLELNKNLTKVGGRDNETYLQEGIIGMRHGSVLEHSSVTFFLKDVSRIVTHELVRHRAGTAFSQTSGRYVRTDVLDFYVPKILESFPGATEEFIAAMAETHCRYKRLEEITGIAEMKDFGLKKKVTSAIRRILGNGQANHIVVTANHRAWRHIVEVRTDPGAEEEIRLVISDVAVQLKARYPAIYADMVLCEDGIQWKTGNSKV